MIEALFTCRTCGADKPRTDEFFFRTSQRLDGLFSSCKICCRDARRMRRRANPIKTRAIERQERSTPEYKAKRAARVRKKRADDREAVNAKRREYYARKLSSPWPTISDEERRERARAAVRAHWAKNRETYRVKTRNYLAKKRLAAGFHTLADLQTLEAVQGDECFWCGQDFGKGMRTIDHYFSLAKGGTNWPSNLVFSCKSCNSAKKDQDPMEFRAKIRSRYVSSQK